MASRGPTYNPLSIEEGEKEPNRSDKNAERDSYADAYHTPYVSLETASPFSCYICLLNTVLGGGILGLPYVMSQTGWILGTLLFMMCGAFSCFGLHELSHCARMCQIPSSFYSVAMKAAPSYVWLIDFAVAIKCFGVGTSYLLIFVDLMPDAASQMGASGIWVRRATWLVICAVLVTPIAFLSSFGSIKLTSSMALTIVCMLTAIVVMYAAAAGTQDFDGEETAHNKYLNPCYHLPSNYDDDYVRANATNTHIGTGTDCAGSTMLWNTNFMDILRVFPILVYSFTCHQNAFNVVNELTSATPAKVDKVFVASMGSALVTFLTFSYAGYYTYGDNILPDALRSYPETVVITIARIFLSFSILLTFPLQCNPCRNCCTTILRYIYNDGKEFSAVSEQQVAFYLTCGILIGSVTITSLTNNLGIVFALIGASGSTMVSYILPGGFFYVLTAPSSSPLAISTRGEEPAPTTPVPTWKRNLSLTQLCMGCLIIPVCIASIVINTFYGGAQSTGE